MAPRRRAPIRRITEDAITRPSGGLIGNTAGRLLLATALLGGPSSALVPNYVETTLHNEGVSNLVSVSYADGFGRTIQTRLDLANGKSLIGGQYFDDAGRPTRTPLPFVYDFGAGGRGFIGMYGTKNSEVLINEAAKYYQTVHGSRDTAYTEVAYYADPTSRVKAKAAPGHEFSLGATAPHYTMQWGFPVRQASTNYNVTVTVDGTSKTMTFSGGFLTASCLSLPNLDALERRRETNPCTFTLAVTRDANGAYAQTLTDAFGRTRKTWNCTGSGDSPSGTIVSSAVTYDALGNVLSETPPGTGLVSPSTKTYTTSGQVIQISTPDAGTVRYAHDRAGRVRFIKTALHSSLDAGSNVDHFLINIYDQLGRIEFVCLNTDPGLSFAEPDESIVPASDPGSAGDKVIIVQRNVYDDHERLLELDLGRTRGEVAGIVAELTKERTPNSRGRLVASMAYCDTRPEGSGASDFGGGVNTVVDITGYDRAGEVEVLYKLIPGLAAQKTSFIRDRHGRVAVETYEDGRGGAPVQNTFTYDSQGRLTELSQSGQTQVRYDYASHGPLTRKTHGNALLATDHSHDIRGWLTKIQTADENSTVFSEILGYQAKPASAGGSFAARYDGNISHSYYACNNTECKLDYLYDGLSRLIGVDNGTAASFDEAFAYDAAGRLTQKRKGAPDLTSWNKPYTYYKSGDGTLATSRLQYVQGTERGKTTAGNPNYLYDPNGNMVLDRYKKMAVDYDYRNLPVAFRFYGRIPDPPSTEGDLTWRDVRDNGLMGYDDDGLAPVSCLSTVETLYDAGGNRVVKAVYGGE